MSRTSLRMVADRLGQIAAILRTGLPPSAKVVEEVEELAQQIGAFAVLSPGPLIGVAKRRGRVILYDEQIVTLVGVSASKDGLGGSARILFDSGLHRRIPLIHIVAVVESATLLGERSDDEQDH